MITLSQIANAISSKLSEAAGWLFNKSVTVTSSLNSGPKASTSISSGYIQTPLNNRELYSRLSPDKLQQVLDVATIDVYSSSARGILARNALVNVLTKPAYTLEEKQQAAAILEEALDSKKIDYANMHTEVTTESGTVVQEKTIVDLQNALRSTHVYSNSAEGIVARNELVNILKDQSYYTQEQRWLAANIVETALESGKINYAPVGTQATKVFPRLIQKNERTTEAVVQEKTKQELQAALNTYQNSEGGRARRMLNPL